MTLDYNYIILLMFYCLHTVRKIGRHMVEVYKPALISTSQIHHVPLMPCLKTLRMKVHIPYKVMEGGLCTHSCFEGVTCVCLRVVPVIIIKT
jgi:hypothetical protein